MHKYATIILALAFISTAVYAFTSSETLSERVERENRETLIRCLDEASRKSTTEEVLRAKNACSENILTKIVQPITNTWTASGAIVPPPPKWYTAKHQLNLSGATDYRIYSDRKWAVWKNNNPSGITYPVSPTLRNLWTDRGIRYEMWTPRPKVEWWNYYRFMTIEEGLRAKIVSIRERWEKATVAHFLGGWWTDHVDLSFDKSKTIAELTEEEFAELFIQQLKKESPWLVDQLVKDKILIIWHAE